MRDESLDLRGELRDGVFEIHGAQGTSDGRVYKLLDQPLRSARTRTKHQKENPTIPRSLGFFFRQWKVYVLPKFRYKIGTAMVTGTQ